MNPALSGKRRSEISKRAWRKRKREGGKATCIYCLKPIFAGGVRMNGKPYHKVCAELAGAGIRRQELVKNLQDSRKRAPRDAFRYFGAGELNPRYIFGPTGFRPPSRWFAKMSQGASASYFGKKLKDLTKAQSAKIGQIVGGIWAGYSDKTRLEILKKYEPSAILSNPLPCPNCQTLNPISRANVYLKCKGCGMLLRRVNVKQRR